jgi:hypothetical protein
MHPLTDSTKEDDRRRLRPRFSYSYRAVLTVSVGLATDSVEVAGLRRHMSLWLHKATGASTIVLRRAVEVELALFHGGANLAADLLPGVQVPLADEGDGGAFLAGPTGAANAVDVGIGVLR